jgi:competence protein ComEA
MQAEMQAAVQAAVAATLSAAPAPAPEATRAPADVEPPAGLSLGQPLALPTPTAGAAALQDATASRAAQIDLAGAGALINVNTATGPELESLPGIGPAKAQAIIANRPYATVEELDRVPGIGPATLEQIRPLVTTE